jgi:hypothetical protein
MLTGLTGVVGGRITKIRDLKFSTLPAASIER